MKLMNTLCAVAVAGFALVGVPAFAQEETAAEPETAAAPQAAAPVEPAAPQQAQAQRIFRGQSVVIVEGKAESNGIIALTFEPQGGEAKLIRINVVAKTKAKKIAQDLANEVAFAAGANYKVKANDEKVKIEAKTKNAPVFHLGIEEQALDGVSVRITKG